MRRYPRVYGFSIFCLLLGTFVLAFSARAQGTSTITGKVTGDGDAPVVNVAVVVFHFNTVSWEGIASDRTNASGDYQVTNLESGTYRIAFFPPTNPRNYFDQYYNGVTQLMNATDIIVPEATTVRNINVHLDSGAHIKGKVTGPANENLTGIQVAIYNLDFYKAVTTQADGTYDVNGLGAGVYYVRFSDFSGQPQYATEDFNNKQLGEMPTAITVTDGQIRGSIDAQLEKLGTVKGRVTDLAGVPLEGIRIVGERLTDYPFSNDVSEEVYGYSNASGTYRLTGIYSDTWRIKFRDDRYGRYQEEWYNDTDNPNQVTPLLIAFNSTTSNINAQLTTRGTITGRLTNRQGQPIANIEVKAEGYYQLHTDWYWSVIAESYSDAAGRYTLCCINRGRYRISFTDTQKRYIPEYYQDIQYDAASTPETVKMVQVTPTLTTTNINAQLNDYSVFAGTVTDHRGTVAPEVVVNLYRRQGTGGSWQFVNVDTTDTNGKYRIESTPGTYRASFFDDEYNARYIGEYYNNAPNIDSATDISLTAEATTTVDVVLIALGRITGTVTDEQGKPVEGISVYRYDLSTIPGKSWNLAASAYSDSNGHYALNGLAGGTYRIEFVDLSYPKVYISQFYNNQPTLETADDIVVESGITVANRNAQLKALAQINGTVRDSSGNPLSFVYPTFYRYEAQVDGSFMWTYVTEVETNQNGNYFSEGLTPGLYRLQFQRSLGDYRSEWHNKAGYLAAATTITLTEGTVLTINAQLINEPFTWPPFADSDSLTVIKGGTATQLDHGQMSVLYDDQADSGNPLQATTVARPQHGSFTLNSNGTFTYTHDGSEARGDFFTYRNHDGLQSSNLATVTISILPINAPPVAQDDTLLVLRGETATTLVGGATSLLANDSDPDDATLSAAVLTNPQHGTLTLNSNGTFTYHHNGDSATSDSFTYRALDGFGAADSATVTITIADEAPLTFNKTVSIEGIKPRCTTVAEMKVPVGTTIVYCYTVRNNNTQAVTSHSLVDSHLGQLLTNAAFNLAPGATYSTTFTQTLSVTTTNVATWTAIVAPAETNLLAPLAITAQKAATVRIAGPKDDSDNDTIPDNLERAGDIDGDNIPNFLDTDADGDGVGDQAEVGASPLQPQDSNNNGIPDYLDATIQTGGTDRLYLPLIYR